MAPENFKNPGEIKLDEYLSRIAAGESKDSILNGMEPGSWMRTQIESRLADSENKTESLTAEPLVKEITEEEKQQERLLEIQQEEQDRQKTAEIRERLGMEPAPVQAAEELEVAEKTESAQEFYDQIKSLAEEINTYSRSLDNRRINIDNPSFLAEIKEKIDMLEAPAGKVIALIEDLRKNGKLPETNLFVDTNIKAIRSNLDDLKQYSEGRHFYVAELQKSLDKITSASNSLLSEHKRVNI